MHFHSPLSLRTLRRVARFGLFAAVVGVIVAAGGFYDVAATKGHLWVVDRFLRLGMTRSVSFHAPDVAPPPFDGDQIRLGAAYYRSGCAWCHGAPDERVNPIVANMLPQPPDLRESVSEWSDPQLHRIVQHGLKYTGMPGWPAPMRAEEVWSVVAFLRELPRLNAHDYRALAGGEAATQEREAGAIARGGGDVRGPDACARCHGLEQGPPSAFAPILAGQPREALLAALRDYASGARRSGFMEPAAAALTGDEMERLAELYASTPAPAPKPASGAPSLRAAGQALASAGDPVRAIPPCATCHEAGARRDFPRLSGQNAPYLQRRLSALREGTAGTGAHTSLMSMIAARLSDADIAAAVAYYSAASPEAASQAGLAR